METKFLNTALKENDRTIESKILNQIVLLQNNLKKFETFFNKSLDCEDNVLKEYVEKNIYQKTIDNIIEKIEKVSELSLLIRNKDYDLKKITKKYKQTEKSIEILDSTRNYWTKEFQVQYNKIFENLLTKTLMDLLFYLEEYMQEIKIEIYEDFN